MTTLHESLNYTPLELNFGTSGLRGLLTDMTDLECFINASGFLGFLETAQQLSPGSTIYVAGDLRDSTPRILQSVIAAITEKGHMAVHCGFIPTPALAYYALQNNAACIMVTGSHIPADRNGIKFYKLGGEILKQDEQAIKSAVSSVRAALYEGDSSSSLFNETGSFRSSVPQLTIDDTAKDSYISRYQDAFSTNALAGKKIVFYQHSAVGRDIVTTILENLGAEVIPVGRSDIFIPIDSENVTPDDQRYFKELAREHPGLYAIVSTDGDSDRPFVIDENGDFHRGDELGAIVTDWIKPDFAAYSISSNDAVDTYLEQQNIPYVHTKIGSPYIITAMQESGAARAIGWEVNGGYLLGTRVDTANGSLEPLPTRDAVLPIVVALVSAAEKATSLSGLFSILTPRFTSSGLIDEFPNIISKQIVEKYSTDSEENKKALSHYFDEVNGFGTIDTINSLDGVRLYFSNGDIAHLRPSGNAPQLRIYSVADSQARADQIVALSIAEPHGIFRTIERSLANEEE